MLVCCNSCPLHPINFQCIGQCSVTRKAVIFWGVIFLAMAAVKGEWNRRCWSRKNRETCWPLLSVCCAWPGGPAGPHWFQVGKTRAAPWPGGDGTWLQNEGGIHRNHTAPKITEFLVSLLQRNSYFSVIDWLNKIFLQKRWHNWDCSQTSLQS